MRRERPTLFKRRHFEAEIIVVCVRWYLRYPLSFRQLEEIMSERNLNVDHVTIWRWVQRYAPELNRRCRPQIRDTNRSWRVDETYCRVAGRWTYLYRAVDFISRGGFNRRYDRLPSDRKARRPCGEAFSAESFAVTRPSSSAGDQRGREPVVPQGHSGVEEGG